MSYSIPATMVSPMLVIYLLDISASMANATNRTSRIEELNMGLKKTVIRMIHRSTKGASISPRYKIAMIAYNDKAFDLLNGVMTIKELTALGLPEFVPNGKTNTALAFELAEKLLEKELPEMTSCPPPLVCHITDGEYTGEDPEPIVNRIMNMAVPDGNVLVQNIFISDNIIKADVSDISHWSGISSVSELSNEYAKKLYAMSSKLPESYRRTINEMGFNLESNVRMMIPAIDSAILNLGFAMSGSTPFYSLK